MGSKDVTVTDARMKEVLRNQVKPIISETVPPMINKSLEEVRLFTGIATKFYHYLDKVEVKLDNSDSTVLCKRLHIFGGDLVDLFTPTADHQSFCDKLKEPCIIPRDTLHCLVINIFDNSDEYLLLGFFQVEEFVGLNPAKPGNLKICAVGGLNQFWIKFGHDGLDIRTNETPTTNVGDMDADMSSVVYADSGEVYTKEEVYTKSEVDELIAAKIAEALEGE
ncbi:hypothetical protein [Methanobrevibacter sp.]|uniref:hypothetical protein n=1 Tax=Methanobrevibacter sp. TaxID=66852 RepID=UPI0025ED5396|nr:hypothetical protein [Methanobrevibacter sp.]MBQ6511756.1 hypothetical protein [Methanobrevibacter sp.]MBQ6513028.1 hypothetical protein [Methanobrevibacter sp.]